MREIKAIIKPERLPDVLRALHTMPDLPGVTVSTVRGFGRRYPPEGTEQTFDEIEMTKLEIVVPDELTAQVVETIERAARTGRIGDGKIFVMPMEEVVRIRTGERGSSAI